MEDVKIAFFDTKPYDKAVFNEQAGTYPCEIKYFDTKLTEDTVSLAQGYDAVCVFVNDTISKPVVDQLARGQTKLVALRCSGFNNVDLDASKGTIRVCRVPEYSPYAVAEHTVGLMLTLNRRIHKAYARLKEHNFSIHGLMGMDLHGKTAGVIGTGRIGKCVIKILRGMGMNVVAYDAVPDSQFANENSVHYGGLSGLLSSSDVILLHCPLNAQTKYILNDSTITQMKDGVMLINTGRGALIQTTALLQGLKQGKVGAAALDVYEEEEKYFFEDRSEQIIDDELLARLLTFPNVLITSHQGFFTKEAMGTIAQTTLDNIVSFFRDDKLPNEIS